MSLAHFPLLSTLVLLPALAGTVALRLDDTRARRIALVATAASVVLGLLALVAYGAGDGAMRLTELGARVPFVGLRWRLGVDGLSVVLLPLTALVALAVVVAGPRARLDRRHVAAVLFTQSATLGLFCSLDLLLLLAFWVLRLVPSAALILRGHDDTMRERLGRTYTIFLFGSALPLALAVAGIGWLGWQAGSATPFDLLEATARGVPASWQPALFLLVALAVLMRMAVVPFHTWLPVLLERGPFGTATIIAGAHVALFVLARTALPLLPVAAERAMPLLASLALVSALYGAVLTLVQSDLRRMVGFLIVSQKGLMMMGLTSMNSQSVAGAMLQSIASGVATTGLLLCTWALEARTGSSRMEDLGGLARQSPRLAVAFFLFGFAAVGFPGTLTFVSEDLLLHGVLHAHPFVAALLLLSTSVTGIAFLRAFGRVFLGPVGPERARLPVVDLLPRERVAALLLSALVLGGGLLPMPLLQVRRAAVEAIVTHDAHQQMRARSARPGH
jgi:NADH-quinone oxidoreductase subunit M